jgi:hypothetical protein
LRFGEISIKIFLIQRAGNTVSPIFHAHVFFLGLIHLPLQKGTYYFSLAILSIPALIRLL